MGNNKNKPVEIMIDEDLQTLLDASKEFQRYSEIGSYSSTYPVVEKTAESEFRSPPMGLVIRLER